MAKVIIYLPDHEAAALNNLAQREYRAPKAQAALIIRKELDRLGMIEILPTKEQTRNDQRPESDQGKAL